MENKDTLNKIPYTTIDNISEWDALSIANAECWVMYVEKKCRKKMLNCELKSVNFQSEPILILSNSWMRPL
jgi:hypothetical protein